VNRNNRAELTELTQLQKLIFMMKSNYTLLIFLEAEAYFIYVRVSTSSTLCMGAGETLQDERVNGGAFIGSDGLQFPHKLIPVSFIYL